MNLSIQDFDFLDAFDNLGSFTIDEHGKNKLDLFVLNINANEFNLKRLEELLIDPMIDYSLSRSVREQYKNKSGTLTKKAKEKFIDYVNNKGELGELLLYCFLETHLKAPKILSKLELKTSTSLNVNGADGVHFLRLENGDYQLIFGESKTIVGLTDALTDAFKSIDKFKREVNDKGNKKSGLPYEKSLISDHLGKETFTKEEKDFISKIVYPKKENDFEVDDAFGIFVGYEITIDKEDKKLPNEDFRKKIQEQIKKEVESKLSHITNKINEFNLYGHSFYLYILPLTELDKNREIIMQGLQS
ncbi:DUF1837 domain-containing protein [Sulfurimonas sp. CS5]|uniref:HamA C-terminal domain-containing protein n=1 Tax=Sulfurimonas sp. CS5 TaxID=3391145 RepID=UPI0039E9D1A2